MTAIGVIVALIVAVVGVAAGYFIGYNNRKKTAEAQIGSAEAEQQFRKPHDPYRHRR